MHYFPSIIKIVIEGTQKQKGEWPYSSKDSGIKSGKGGRLLGNFLARECQEGDVLASAWGLTLGTCGSLSLPHALIRLAVAPPGKAYLMDFIDLSLNSPEAMVVPFSITF